MSNSPRSPLAIGVTGGIGSGKTEVCRMFERLGARVLFADAIAKRLTDSVPEIRNRLIRMFGPQIYSPAGGLNRKELAKIIFRDPAAKDRVDAVIHPATLAAIESQIKAEKQGRKTPLIAVEAALIFEAGAAAMFDYIITVTTPAETRIERVIARDGVTRGDVLDRIAAQSDEREKEDAADFVVRNTGDLHALEENCKFLFGLLMSLTPR